MPSLTIIEYMYKILVRWGLFAPRHLIRKEPWKGPSGIRFKKYNQELQ